MKTKVLLSWSSGKDCAWTLHCLRQRDDLEVVALVTTYNEAIDRIAMHGTRLNLVEAQARSAGLPLWTVPLPWPCSNEIDEQRLRSAIEKAQTNGIEAFAFGDLYLEEIRAYREAQLKGTGIQPLFPIWGMANETPQLARTMIESGLRAVLTCVDPGQLDPGFVGRTFDGDLIADLPASVDPCGERGEFHTFCTAGPMFDHPIAVATNGVVQRDGFWFADLVEVLQ